MMQRGCNIILKNDRSSSNPSCHFAALCLTRGLRRSWANDMPPRNLLTKADIQTLQFLFSLAAQKALSPKAWAFYSSAATDLVTVSKNKELIRRVMLRPRILRNVAEVSIKRNILGLESKAPFIMCPAAMATLAHPDGELGWSRAAASEGIFEIVSQELLLYEIRANPVDLE